MGRFIIFVLLIVASIPCLGQVTNLDFITKDFKGNEMPLIDRLDPDRNYIIDFAAFWCNPCNVRINGDFVPNKKKYLDELNLEIILLNDEHYDIMEEAEKKLLNNLWNFQMYFTDDIYSDLGVNAIPRYFFKPAGQTEVVQMSWQTTTFVENFYRTNGFQGVFDNRIEQTIAVSACLMEPLVIDPMDAFVVDNVAYFDVGEGFLSAGIANENIYRHNATLTERYPQFLYNLNPCDSYTMHDADGDTIVVTIEERIEENGKLELITDVEIFNSCTEETYPLVLNPAYGSNAGLSPDISDGYILDVLVCSATNDEVTYTDAWIVDACLPVSTKEEFQDTYSIYPSPSDGIFHFYSEHVGGLQITLFDLAGNKITQLQDVKNGDALDFSYLNNGMYLLEIEGSKGSFVEKVVISK